MNSRTLAALIGVILVSLVAIFLIARGGRGEPGEDRRDSAQEPLTALRKGNEEPPEEEPPPVERTVVEPVPVNIRTLLSGDASLAVSPEEVEQALEELGRRPDDLIAAQAVLGDFAYLREAAEKLPDDPKVQFWILANNVFPEQRAEWLDRYKKSQPDNSLANYLAAQEAFRNMDYETGLEELRQAAGKELADPSAGVRQRVEDLYLATGQFDEKTALYGTSRMNPMPHIDYVQSLSSRLIEHHSRLVEAEDAEGAAEVMRLGLEMLGNVREQVSDQSVGARAMMMLMEEQLRRNAGEPEEELEPLRAERQRVGYLGTQLQEILGREDLATDEQLHRYAEAIAEMGEGAATEWFIGEIGEIPAAGEDGQ